MSHWKKIAFAATILLVPATALAAYQLAANDTRPLNSNCKCGADCKCGTDCKCGKDCKCGGGADCPHPS